MPSSQCPAGTLPCHTLSQYAHKPNDYFSNPSNITLILLPGNHILDVPFKFNNATLVVKIQAQKQSVKSSLPVPVTTVTCNDSTMFVFNQVKDVTMSGLAFYGCTNNAITSAEQFILEDSIFCGQYRNGTGLDLAYITNATVMRSTFVENTGKLTNNSIWPWKIGGAIAASHIQNLTIMNSTFSKNYVQNTQYAHGGAVHISEIITVSFSDCAFSNNTAFSTASKASGGALTMNNELLPNYASVSITNCLFTDNRVPSNWFNSAYGGAVSVVYRKENGHIDVDIGDSIFTSNSVHGCSQGRGGAVYVSTMNGTVNVSRSVFVGNTVWANITARGGAIMGSADRDVDSELFIFDSTFTNNSVHTANDVDGAVNAYGGAVCCYLYTTVNIFNTNVTHCMANTSKEGAGGGVLVIATYSIVTMKNCQLLNNTLIGNTSAQGGAMFVGLNNGATNISTSTFTGNTVFGLGRGYGGALAVVENHFTIANCKFHHNSVTGQGAAISVSSLSFTSTDVLDIQYNVAHYGALFAYNSELELSGYTTISNNYYQNSTQEGTSHDTMQMVLGSPNLSNTHQTAGQGGMTLYQSKVTLSGTITLSNNTAKLGGAILLSESTLHVEGDIMIVSNHAFTSGGGIYAYQSGIKYSSKKNFNTTVTISENTAQEDGGGMYASSSQIKLYAHGDTNIINMLQFTSNRARRGGGIYMEANSRLYVIKTRAAFYPSSRSYGQLPLKFDFTDNEAEYGGAIYVLDDVNSGVCQSVNKYNFNHNSTQAGECFFQAFRGYAVFNNEARISINLNSLNFTSNYASRAGAILYGGLLDRCAVSPFSEVYAKSSEIAPNPISGVTYLLNITNLEPEDLNSVTNISSNAVRVCFCLENVLDCSYQPPVRYIRRGELFHVSVAAVDQVNNSIPATIFTSLSSSVGGRLALGQLKQMTSDSDLCTDLNYTISSPLQTQSHTLLLYAAGPCNNTGISQRYYRVAFLPCNNCPIGFTADENCVCTVCASELKPYIVGCFIEYGTLQAKTNYWINYTDERGYTGHQCPFDYCDQSTVRINLNSSGGSDAHCAFNRSGWLCGECKPGYSLSLGSSRCKPDCTDNWLSLIILFALAGVALVAIILVCNITVATGTINGLVFYANIIEANHAIFFPARQPKTHPLMGQNPLTVFISWINLDFGIEACFYRGMDAYVNTWLQLAFPFYILILVILIIRICKHSSKLSKLILLASNPVAALATLILLSYTKILRAILAALAFTDLKFSGTPSMNETFETDFVAPGSRRVWLIDANVDYLRGKHIGLFLVAIFLLIVGLMYTFLLFSWQWLYPILMKSSYLSSSEIIRNTNHFMDTYHAPFKPKHGYWVGLLLLVRAALYLISVVNVFGDLQVTLLAIILATVCLLGYQSLKIHVYKMWLLSFLETTFFINLIILANLTFFISNLDADKQSDRRVHAKSAVVYSSISIAFITFIGIVGYHTYYFIFKKIRASPLQEQQPERNSYRELTDEPLRETHTSLSTGSLTHYRTMGGSMEEIFEDPTDEDYEIAASQSN